MEAVIYDESDEIALSPELRSDAWRQRRANSPREQFWVTNPGYPCRRTTRRLAEQTSALFTERYADYLQLGVEEWRKSYVEHERLGKKAVLFVMVDDTRNCDEVGEHLVEVAGPRFIADVESACDHRRSRRRLGGKQQRRPCQIDGEDPAREQRNRMLTCCARSHGSPIQNTSLVSRVNGSSTEIIVSNRGVIGNAVTIAR